MKLCLNFLIVQNNMLTAPMIGALQASFGDLPALNDISKYCFGDCQMAAPIMPQQVFPPSYFGQNEPNLEATHRAASERRNLAEYEREQQIEAMTLDKDEKYFHLLKPYKYERVQQGDNLLQKVAFTYVCKYDGCDKTFTKACNFLDHVRMHEGIKPYKCTRCSKEFVQKCNLKKHFKRHLSATLEERKVYKCSICSKGFTERYNLKVSTWKIIVCVWDHFSLSSVKNLIIL